MREKLSALLDDELHADERDEVVRHVSRDNDLNELWGRYHLYRAVFREESFIYNSGLKEKLALQFPLHRESEKNDDSVVKFKQRQAKHPAGDRRPVFAIAASLLLATAVAVFSTYLVPTVPAPGDIALVEQKTKWEMDREHEDTLNGFLVEHGEFISAPGMNGLMGYAKFVSYDSGPE